MAFHKATQLCKSKQSKTNKQNNLENGVYSQEGAAGCAALGCRDVRGQVQEVQSRGRGAGHHLVPYTGWEDGMWRL